MIIAIIVCTTIIVCIGIISSASLAGHIISKNTDIKLAEVGYKPKDIITLRESHRIKIDDEKEKIIDE